jgi:hypothetical protein
VSLVVALALLGDARADDGCVPLDAAGFRALVERAHDALLDDDVAAHDAAVDEIEERVPCLVEIVPADAWARLLYDDALVRHAAGQPWQPLVTAALAADPAVDRSLGSPDVRAFEPVPAAPAAHRPDDVPGRWWLDGRPAPDDLVLVGPHVLQRRDGFGLSSALVIDADGLPGWWAPEPAPVPVPRPSPEPREAPSPVASAPPAPAAVVDVDHGEERLVLRVHAATGVALAFGGHLVAGDVEEPGVKVVVPIEAGVELDAGRGWVRLVGHLAPLVDGTWVYDRAGTPFATRLGGGLALSGGGRFGVGYAGALVGGQDPSRLVFQALGGVQVHRSGLRVELRAGLDLTTTLRVEPAIGALLVFAPRLWGQG